MINLEPRYLSMVKDILESHAPSFEVSVFGSRVRGTNSKYSDLDLALLANDEVSLETLEKLKDAFSESDLPIQVDIIDFQTISGDFKKIISEHREIIQHPITS